MGRSSDSSSDCKRYRGHKRGERGHPGLVWTGAWNAGYNYKRRMAVSYNGSSYVAITKNTNQAPASGSSFWCLVSQGVSAGHADFYANNTQAIATASPVYYPNDNANTGIIVRTATNGVFSIVSPGTYRVDYTLTTAEAATSLQAYLNSGSISNSGVIKTGVAGGQLFAHFILNVVSANSTFEIRNVTGSTVNNSLYAGVGNDHLTFTRIA